MVVEVNIKAVIVGVAISVQILLCTALLARYLKWGLFVTNMYQTLEYVSASPMVWFEVEVSEAIKESDRHKKRLMKKEINCLKND